MTQNRIDPLAQMTGSLVKSSMNTPLEQDDPRLRRAARKAADVERPKEVTVTGNNVPACSRPYLNRTIDHETARVIADGRTGPSPTLNHEAEGGKNTDGTSYEEAVAALKAKYGIA